MVASTFPGAGSSGKTEGASTLRRAWMAAELGSMAGPAPGSAVHASTCRVPAPHAAIQARYAGSAVTAAGDRCKATAAGVSGLLPQLPSAGQSCASFTARCDGPTDLPKLRLTAGFGALFEICHITEGPRDLHNNEIVAEVLRMFDLAMTVNLQLMDVVLIRNLFLSRQGSSAM